MHKQLENYLNEVAKGLGSLPTARREEEISEIRQHLLSAVAASKEAGQTEDEAVQIAVEQFGTPQAVSKQIASAWRRGVVWNRSNFWGATACSFGLALLLAIAHNLIALAYFDYSGPTNHPIWENPLVACWFIMGSIIQGAVINMAFPKTAVRGTVTGMAAFVLLDLYLVHHTVSLHPNIRAEHGLYASIIARFILQVLIAALFVRAGNWWRRANGKRYAQAAIGD